MTRTKTSPAHDLIPDKLLKTLPEFGKTDDERDPIARIRFFDPTGFMTWFVIEYDPRDKIAYGWVCGHYHEFGTFSMTELMAVRGHLNLPIERDLHFKPCRLSKLPDHERPDYL